MTIKLSFDKVGLNKERFSYVRLIANNFRESEISIIPSFYNVLIRHKKQFFTLTCYFMGNNKTRAGADEIISLVVNFKCNSIEKQLAC